MESKEVESAVNLFQFDWGFQRNYLEVGNLNKFAKGLNIYFPSHLLKKNKDICFSAALFYLCKPHPPVQTKYPHIMQRCNFNPFHHRGACTRSSSFPNIQENTSRFWIIQTITSGFSNQLILLFLQGWNLLCCKMVMARRIVPRSEKGIFSNLKEQRPLCSLDFQERGGNDWEHHFPCSWPCRGCQLDTNPQYWTHQVLHLLYSTVGRKMHFLIKNPLKNLLLNKEWYLLKLLSSS